MKRHGSSMILAFAFGATLAALGGCPAKEDELPPDTTSSSGTGGSGGGSTTCGDGKLDSGETCDDGNNSSADGCTSCAVDECFECTADPGTLSTCTASTMGTACQSTKVCDGNGACVECLDDSTCNGGYCFQNACATCDDGMKNGDETDVDCGGTHCGKCTAGKTCGLGDDCESTFCADGVCCNEACDEACLSCSLTGTVGECSFIGQYGEDTSYGAGESCLSADGEACTAGASCAAAVGQPCAGNADCASTRCADPDMDMVKNCVALTGDPCAQNTDCLSGTCDNGTCM